MKEKSRTPVSQQALTIEKPSLEDEIFHTVGNDGLNGKAGK